MGTNRELSKDVIFQNAVTTVGTGTVVGVAGFSSIGIQISGSFVSSIRFEATINGTDWKKLRCYNIETGVFAFETDDESAWIAPCAGLSGVRIISGH